MIKKKHQMYTYISCQREGDPNERARRLLWLGAPVEPEDAHLARPFAREQAAPCDGRAPRGGQGTCHRMGGMDVKFNVMQRTCRHRQQRRL